MKAAITVSILLAFCVGMGTSQSQCTDIGNALIMYAGSCTTQLYSLSGLLISTPTSEQVLCQYVYDLLDCIALQISNYDVTAASTCLAELTSVGGNVSAILVGININITDPTTDYFISNIDCGTYYIDFMSSSSSSMSSTYYSSTSSTYSYTDTGTGYTYTGTDYTNTGTDYTYTGTDYTNTGTDYTYTGTTSSSSYTYSGTSQCTDIGNALIMYAGSCTTQLYSLSGLLISTPTSEQVLCQYVYDLLDCITLQISNYDVTAASTCLAELTSVGGNVSAILVGININITDPTTDYFISNIDCGTYYIDFMSSSSSSMSSTYYSSTSSTYSYTDTGTGYTYTGTDYTNTGTDYTYTGTDYTNTGTDYTYTGTTSSSSYTYSGLCNDISQALTSYSGMCVAELYAILSLPDTSEANLCGAVFNIFTCIAAQTYNYDVCLDELTLANDNLTDLLTAANLALSSFALSVPSDVTAAAATTSCSSTYASLMTTVGTYPSGTTGGTIDYSEAIACTDDVNCTNIYLKTYCGYSGYCRLNSSDDTCTHTLDCGDSLLDCIGGYCYPIKKNCTYDQDCFSHPFKYCKSYADHQYAAFAGTGLCVPYTCQTLSECQAAGINDPNLACEEDDVCGCAPGYEENQGVCERILGSSCSIDNQCNLDAAVCSGAMCACETSEIGDTCYMDSTSMISPTPSTDYSMSSTTDYTSWTTDYSMSSTSTSGGIDCSNIGVVVSTIATNPALAAYFDPLQYVTSQDEFCSTFATALGNLSLYLAPSDSETCLAQMTYVAYPSASQILALLPPLGVTLTQDVTNFANNATYCPEASSSSSSSSWSSSSATYYSSPTSSSSTPTTPPSSSSDCSDVAVIGTSILGPAAACQTSFARILTAANLNEFCSNFTAGIVCVARIHSPGAVTQCMKEMKTEIAQNATALLEYVVANVLSTSLSLLPTIQGYAQSAGNCTFNTSDGAIICSENSHCTDMWENLYCGPSQVCMKPTVDPCTLETDCRHSLLKCLEDSSNAPNRVCTPVIEECGTSCTGEPLTYCETWQELGFAVGYCNPTTCTDNSTCTVTNLIADSYCSPDGACDCAPGYYFVNGMCTNILVTGVGYSIGLIYQNNYPLVQHKCEISDQLLAGLTYEVKWYRSGASSAALKTMAVTAATFASDIVLNDNELPNTYILNDEVYCEVSVQDSGMEVQPPFASARLKLLEVTTNVSLVRGEKKEFCFTLGFPFACQPGESCTFDLMAYDSTDDNSCSAMSLAISGNGTCGCKATPKTQADVTTAGGWLSYTPEEFCCYITTKNEFKRSFTASKSLTLKTAFSASSLPVPYVEGVLSQAVSATVTDPFPNIPSCKLFSNGYVWTFDSSYVSLRGGSATARYVAYRHTETNTEIQIGMKLSQSNNLPEITSVFVRSGRSVAKLQHSSLVHKTGILQTSLDGTHKLRFFKLNNNQYSIRLPHGTELVVHIESEYGFSLTGAIFASPSDAGKTEGLCGNLDGDDSNDPTDGGSWIATDDFDLSATRSALTDWAVADQKCICSSPYTENNKICSVLDDEVCSGGAIDPEYGSGYDQTVTRRRRSVEEVDYQLVEELSNYDTVHNKIVDAHPISKRDAASCDKALTTICPMLDNTYLFIPADRQQIVDTQCGSETNTSVDWARLSCTPFQIVAIQHWYRDEDIKASNPEYEDICAGGCLNNATCVNGSCECADGFGGDNCHVNITKPPVVISERSIEVSIVEPPSCFNMTSSDGFTSTSTCRMLVITGTVTLQNTIEFSQSSATITFTALFRISTYVGQCCSSATGRRRRSTGNTNTQYQVSVSNDNQTFSDPIVVTTLDTTCQNITTFPNGTNYVELKSGYCFIEGICYNESDANPSSSCQICRTSYSLYNWNDTCVHSTAKDDGLPGYAIALIVISVLLVIGVVAAVLYIFVLKKKLNRGIGDIFGLSRGLVREPTNSKFIMVRKDGELPGPWVDPDAGSGGVPGMTGATWQPSSETLYPPETRQPPPEASVPTPE